MLFGPIIAPPRRRLFIGTSGHPVNTSAEHWARAIAGAHSRAIGRARRYSITILLHHYHDLVSPHLRFNPLILHDLASKLGEERRRVCGARVDRGL